MQKSFTAELYEVEHHHAQAGGAAAGAGTGSFSLLFRTDRSTDLPQGLYNVEHPQLGKIGLFLVPIGMRSEHARVEKFNPALRLYERLGFRAIADKGVY